MSKETKQYLLVIALPKVLFVLLVGAALSFRVSQDVLVLFGALSLSAVILPIVDARSRSLVPALAAGLTIPLAARCRDRHLPS